MSDRPAAEEPDNRTIIELEDRLDARFRHRGLRQPLDQDLTDTARRWSQAVWSASQASEPQQLAASEVDRGLALAQRPVFVCGVQRSGTTLLRDLLDGHPQLAVIPTESGFYTSLEQALFGLGSDRHAGYLACRWLERLVLPPPHRLLGRTQASASPYVDFARSFAAWWRVSERRPEARIASWPLCAFALAVAQQIGPGRIPSSAQMWVEKSPTSERFLQRIWHDFPAARVIHIVRRPEAALASYAALNRHLWGPGSAAAHCMRSLAPSYRIAGKGVFCPPNDRYLLVRYEELVAGRAQVMARIAAFLSIEPSPVLLEPTVAGRPAVNNSSFGPEEPRLSLSPFERALLALTVARNADRLGYAPGDSPSPRNQPIAVENVEQTATSGVSTKPG